MGLGGSKHGIKTLNSFKANDIKRASPRMRAELVIAIIAGVASGYFIYSPSLKEVTDKYRNTVPGVPGHAEIQPQNAGAPSDSSVSMNDAAEQRT